MKTTNATSTDRRERLQTLCFCGLLCALLCVLCPWTIPLQPIPLTLGTFAISMVALSFPLKLSLPSIAGYLALGMVGVPVFSGWTGGLWKLTSPTGGYLIAYLPMCMTIFAVLKLCGNGFFGRLLAGICGHVVLYLFGTSFFALFAGRSFVASLSACVLPFLPGDAAKLLVAVLLAPAVTAILHRVK